MVREMCNRDMDVAGNCSLFLKQGHGYDGFYYCCFFFHVLTSQSQDNLIITVSQVVVI